MIVLLESTTFVGIRSSSLCRRPSRWLSSKEYACKAGDAGDGGSIPGSGRCPGGGHGNTTPVFLPGESHGQRNLLGYIPWGRKELDMTEAT